MQDGTSFHLAQKTPLTLDSKNESSDHKNARNAA
nr:MAG TPA: hypothetical protein [Caudoviricetes sp.]